MKQLNRIKISQPDLETLCRIAQLLDADVRELLHIEKDKSKYK